MSGKEIEKEPVVVDSGAADAGSVAGGIAAELTSQLQNFETSKNSQVNKSTERSQSGLLESATKIDTFIEFERPLKELSLTDKDRKEAIKGLGESLQNMIKGELPQLQEMMQRNGLDTAAIDLKIKAAEKEAAAVRPLQDAVVSGDIKAVQKLLAQMTPEQLTKYSELLQKHFDKAGMGIELDSLDGQLIISRTNGERAVVVGKDKTDVIGINKDGSYDFNRQYRRENPASELQGMSDGAVRNYIHPRYIKEQFYNHEVTTKAYPEGGFMPREFLDRYPGK